MELSSITNKLVENVRRTQIEQIVTITKVLGLKVGSQFLADVQKVTQATPEERAELVKSIEANLAQLSKNSTAPAIKALISDLEAQKNIAQAPNVKLVTVAVNVPTNTPTPVNTATAVTTTPQLPPATTLLTYTNQPIQVGQTLLMQLSEGQRLQLLQPLTKAQVAAFNVLLQTTNPQITSTNELLSTLLEPNRNISTQTADTIGETLRRLLPQKDMGQDLLTSLPKITRFIQQLPLAERKDWLSSQVQQSLKTLANHIRLSDQLSNPKLLEMTMQNNGQSFENKLAQLIAGQKNNELTIAPAVNNSLLPKSPTGKNSFDAATGAVSALLKPVNPIATTKQTIPPQISIEKMASQDLKGALLGLLHELDTELETAKPALPGISPANELNKNVAAIGLPQLLSLLANKQQGELNQKQLRTQLVMLMHQYTLGSIAKVQLQQVHALNHQLNQVDQAQPTQSWQFELPVRQGHDVHPLHIQMEQQWVEEQNEDAEHSSTRMRQWNIMFSFDLPLVGKFYAQLLLLGENLSAKFWAENENTLLEAKNKIDGLKAQLEHEGIQVTQLQCVQGLPPKTKMSFSYSLVDIKT